MVSCVRGSTLLRPFLRILMPVVTSESSDEEPAKPKGGRGGLMAEKEISDDMMNLLGCKKKMARTDVVKRMWEYIRVRDDGDEAFRKRRLSHLPRFPRNTICRTPKTNAKSSWTAE